MYHITDLQIQSRAPVKRVFTEQLQFCKIMRKQRLYPNSGSASFEGPGLCGLWRPRFPLPRSVKVTIVSHAMSPFSFSLSSFSGAQRILRHVRTGKMVAVHPQKQEKEGASGGAFRLGQPSHGIVMWLAFECSFKGCRLWIETQSFKGAQTLKVKFNQRSFSPCWRNVWWSFVGQQTFLELYSKPVLQFSPECLESTETCFKKTAKN